MNIWSKVITAVRSGDNWGDELLLDSQAMKILDEEVRNTTQTLKRLEQSLATMQQQLEQCQAKQDKLRQAIAQLEGYAIKAIEKADEDLALAIAKKIAATETQLQQGEEQSRYYQSQRGQLQQVMDLTQQNLTRLRQQVDMVRASESVHRAQQTIVSQQASEYGKVLTAMDALKRLKQRQANKSAGKPHSQAGDNKRPKKSLKANSNKLSGSTDSIYSIDAILDDDELQQRLIHAGIIDADPEVNQPNINDIMQRLMERAHTQDNNHPKGKD